MRNDPAVGHWILFVDPQRGTHDIVPLTQEAITGALTANANIGDIVSAAQIAQQKAYGIIESYYKNSGKLARDDKDPDVLVSRQTNLAYYARSNANPTISLAAANQYCASLNTPGYGPWRVATAQDVHALTAMSVYGIRQGGIKLPDAPDNRLWRNLIQGGNPALITGSYQPANQARDRKCEVQSVDLFCI